MRGFVGVSAFAVACVEFPPLGRVIVVMRGIGLAGLEGMAIGWAGFLLVSELILMSQAPRRMWRLGPCSAFGVDLEALMNLS